MIGKTFTLNCNGVQIGTITDAGYATPTFTGRVIFQDPKMQEQFNKVTDFDNWVVDEAPDDLSDEAYDTEMASRDIEQIYYDMIHGGTWTTIDESGKEASAGLVVFDNEFVEWRPGNL